MLTVRASRLPLATKCPASLVEPAVRVNAQNDLALLGTVVHDALAKMVCREPVDLHAIADAYGLPGELHDDLERLYRQGCRLWREYGSHFPNPITEQPMVWVDETNGITLTGHGDIISIGDKMLRAGDWKSGFVDQDSDDQLRAYGLLGIRTIPGADAVEAAFTARLGLRDQVVDGQRFTVAELNDWWQRTATRIKQQDEYNPGRHCGHCPRFLECPAATQAISQAESALAATSATGAITLPVGKVYDCIKLLEGWSESVLALVRASVEQAGGRLDLGDGRSLVLTEQTQRKIDARIGLPVLQAELSEPDLMGCLTVGKTKVEAAIKANCGKGQKGKAVAAVMDRLEQAGALIPTVVTKLECKRNGPAAIAAA